MDNTVRESPTKANKRGSEVEDWLSETNMTYLNNGEATHISRIDSSLSTPDVSFIHASMIDDWDWKVLPKMGSDHNPIIMNFTIESAIPKVNEIPKYKWNLNKADWEEFSNQIEHDIPNEYDLEKRKTN